MTNTKTEIKFIRNADTVHVQTRTIGSTTDQLPLGIWNLNPPSFSTPPSLTFVKSKFSNQKIFGQKTRDTIKFISGQLNNEERCSVLLEGKKGLGKSMTMKHLANLAIDDGIPVVINNTGWIGDEFNDFIKSLGKVIVLMDEIDKTMPEDANGYSDQEKLLTLLDGVITHDARMIFTSNGHLNYYMYDRPSRIKFLMEFNHIPTDALEEILDEILIKERENDRSKIETLVAKATELNFDNFLSFLKLLNENPDKEIETLAEIFNITINPDDRYKIVSYDLNLAGEMKGFKETFRSFTDDCSFNEKIPIVIDVTNAENESKRISTSISEMKCVKDDKLFYNQYKMEHKDGHVFIFEKASLYKDAVASERANSWL